MQQYLNRQQKREDTREYRNDILDMRDRKNGWGEFDQREAEPGELEAFSGAYFTRLPDWLPYGSAYCTTAMCELHWRPAKEPRQPCLMEA